MSDSFESNAPFEDPRFAGGGDRYADDFGQRKRPSDAPLGEPALGEPPTGDWEPSEPAKRKGGGCFAWGCLGLVVLLLATVAAIAAALYFGSGWLARNFSTDKPAEIEVVELPEEELLALGERIENLQRNARGDAGRVEDLRLTETELNGLIAKAPDLRGRIAVRLRSAPGQRPGEPESAGRLGAEVSVPLDQLPFGFGTGRFLNATVWFEPNLADGRLTLEVVDAQVNGKRLAPEYLAGLRGHDFFNKAAQRPEVRRLVRLYDTLEITDGELILRARHSLEEQAPYKPGQDAAGPSDTAPGF